MCTTQIDHTIINQRWCNSLKDVRVYRGADVGSDHNLAVSTVRLSLAALKKQKGDWGNIGPGKKIWAQKQKQIKGTKF